MNAARLAVANAILREHCNAEIEFRRGSPYVTWTDRRGNQFSRRWQCSGQDFYPTWNRVWPGGGTSMVALSQLIRWVRDRPCLPLGVWRHWVGERVQLWSPLVVDQLRAAGYPEFAKCVLCGNVIDIGGGDWWSVDSVSGPCCSYHSGCRQQKATP